MMFFNYKNLYRILYDHFNQSKSYNFYKITYSNFNYFIFILYFFDKYNKFIPSFNI